MRNLKCLNPYELDIPIHFSDKGAKALERLGTMPKIIQLVSCEARIQPRHSGCLCFFHLYNHSASLLTKIHCVGHCGIV